VSFVIKSIFLGNVRFFVEHGTAALLNKLRDFHPRDVELKNDILVFTVDLMHKRGVCQILGKRSYRIHENRNIFSVMNFFYARGVLMIMAVLCTIAFVVADRFIFRVRIDGVSGEEKMAVVTYLKNNGITRFMPKATKLSPIVQDLVAELDFVAAANMHIDGSTLKISVLRADNLSAEIANDVDIRAICEGVITRMIVLNGSAVASIGEVVHIGDILVAGPRASAIIIIYNGSELVCVINETIVT